ncbi:MAG: YdiU family protein [Bdellovibrionota bacterium]
MERDSTDQKEQRLRNMNPLKIHFHHQYSTLPSSFFQRVRPFPASKPGLRAWNADLADFLQIQADADAHAQELSGIFSGTDIHPDSVPLAMAYSGHQFGHFNPDLGDGRAHLLGELEAKDGQLYEVALKGSGQTQFSRRGDGRAALGPVVREYLVSEAMHALGIPTTRSLAVVETGEPVFRERAFPGAVLTRVALSHIRVGHFEHFASRNQPDHVKTLLNFLIARAYPELNSSSDPALDFFRSLVQRQAKLVAQWMSVGFVHGVMNTDNTSACGLTIDYGPCAFLDETDVNKVFSSIDRMGRYAYGKQPEILQWNLSSLAHALLVMDPEDHREARSKEYIQELESFFPLFEKAWKELHGKKIGLESVDSTSTLLDRWITYLHQEKLDFTLAFRNLPMLLNSEDLPNIYKDTPDFRAWVKDWKHVLGSQGGFDLAVAQMNAVNPCIIARNHIIEAIIQECMQGNYKTFFALEKALANPYECSDQHAPFMKAPLEHEKVTQTFCGT